MNIKLEKINRKNWHEAINLEISDDHDEFVADNIYSIAEGQFYTGMECYAIYNDDKMVGFAMYGQCTDNDDGDDRFWIWRLMIAEGHRRKGYAREAMKIILDEAREKGAKEALLSTEPENYKAIKLYKSLGFKGTGEMEDDEEIYICKLK